MRIVLLTSAEPDFYMGMSFSEKRFPIGVGYLISVLKNAGHEVEFVDRFLLGDVWPKRAEYDYVGIYSCTPCFEDTKNIIRKLKGNGKIMVGGPHTSYHLDSIPDEAAHVCVGEGERAILDIVGGSTERVHKALRLTSKELDDLPSPPFELFMQLPYDLSVPWFPDAPVINMCTSRGCPFNCSFCSIPQIWGKKVTMMSAERIVMDIEKCVRDFGIKGVYFREDNFTMSRYRVQKFCELLIKKNLNVKWCCLLGDTLVFSSSKSGLERIENLKAGDRVLSLNEANCTIESCKVTKKLVRSSDDIYEVKFELLPRVKVTGEHPIMIVKKKAQDEFDSRTSEFVRTREIHKQYSAKSKQDETRKTCCYVVYPFNSQVVDVPELNERKCSLLGYYIARGKLLASNSKKPQIPNVVRFDMGMSEFNRALEIADLVKREFSTSCRISFDLTSVKIRSSEFVKFIKRFCLGIAEKEKLLAREILLLPIEKQRAIIRAAWRFSKHFRKEKGLPLEVVFDSFQFASRPLAIQFQQMLLRSEIVCSCSIETKSDKASSNDVLYKLSKRTDVDQTDFVLDAEKSILYTRLSSIRRLHETQKVFNLEVEKNRNYVTEAGLMHNCETRVDTVDFSLLHLMARAGCKAVYVGFESGSDKMLEVYNKGTTVEQNKRFARWAHKAGIKVAASMIFGHPLETSADRARSKKLILETQPATVFWNRWRSEYETP